MQHFKIYILLLSVAIFSACSSPLPTRPDTTRPDATNASKQVKPSSTTGGGYYLDDGPGDNAPADIDSIPDAALRSEVPLARANKPYSALGQPYTPMTSYAPYKAQGVASWYGKRYHGKKTSTGEIYDMYAMTGAHTILPLPSYVKVTNPANGRSVIVRINDRGPFKRDRLIDLSYAAAYKLRLIGQGSGLVEVEAIDTSAESLQKIATSSAVISGQSEVVVANSVETNAIKSTEVTPTLPSTSATAAASPANTAINTSTVQFYVQVGAFKKEMNGDLLLKKIQSLNLAENMGAANVYNNALYRVRLGPYASKQEADASAASIRTKLNIPTIVLNQ